jgi:hypothetical protein
VVIGAQLDLVFIAIVDELHHYIRAVAIHEEEALSSVSFLLSIALKHLFKPSKSTVNRPEAVTAQ